MQALPCEEIKKTHRRTYQAVGWLILAGSLCTPGQALAGLEALAGQFANDVEEESAVANQATYNALLSDYGGPCRADQQQERGACSGNVFKVFNSTRELVHTANELTGSGPTEFSLGVDLSGLGTALRWTAGEEFSGQGSLSSEFVNGQLSGLTSRVTALRFGASGFFVAGFGAAGESLAATSDRFPDHGMGASEECCRETYSPWGGFVNGSYGYGDKEATGQENAFDFDGFELNLGLDYRWNDNWVTGMVAGYAEREIDFQPVGIFVVDGGIKSDGYSLMPFALYQADRLYASVSLGYQQMSFDSERAIKYPSLNPDVPSTNTRTESSTDSDGWTFQGTLGYGFRLGSFNLEPYLSAEYRDMTVDGFTERDVNDDGFDLVVADQDIESFEGVLGTRLQFTWTPSFGVFVPYLDLQWRRQFEDSGRTIEAAYRAAGAAVDASEIRFELRTDAPDKQYYVISAGVSTILRGGRQRAADGAIAGGIQAYLAYRSIQELENFTHDVITAGLRYEF